MESKIVTKLWLLYILLLRSILHGLVFKDIVIGFIIDDVLWRTLNRLYDLFFLQAYAFFLNHFLLWKFDRMATAIDVCCWIGDI